MTAFKISSESSIHFSHEFNFQPEPGAMFRVIEIVKRNGILIAKCCYANNREGYLALSQFKCEFGINLFTSTFMVAEKIERILIRENYRYPITKYVIVEL